MYLAFGIRFIHRLRYRHILLYPRYPKIEGKLSSLVAPDDDPSQFIHSCTSVIAWVMADALALGFAITFLNHVSPRSVVVDTMPAGSD